ncbi:hypothetical protein ACTFIY_001301 [Dictyostelium cf. discoideum]
MIIIKTIVFLIQNRKPTLYEIIIEQSISLDQLNFFNIIYLFVVCASVTNKFVIIGTKEIVTNVKNCNFLCTNYYEFISNRSTNNNTTYFLKFSSTTATAKAIAQQQHSKSNNTTN